MVPATSRKMKGQLKKMDDVWNIPSINNMAKERMGYPTQKPEALLERIIRASSNLGDIVSDPFCGCGTTLVVVHQLGRKWIGIDVSPIACDLMKKRLISIGVMDIQIIGAPKTIKELKSLKPYEFQAWVINRISGVHSDKKTGIKVLMVILFWNVDQFKLSNKRGWEEMLLIPYTIQSQYHLIPIIDFYFCRFIRIVQLVLRRRRLGRYKPWDLNRFFVGILWIIAEQNLQLDLLPLNSRYSRQILRQSFEKQLDL